MKISPKYTDADWKFVVAGDVDWEKSIDIVEDRITGRWINSADEISKLAFSGFALLVLDCIILESMWGFKMGKSVPRGKEKQTYRDILTGKRFNFTNEQCDDFRTFVRNGLMHDAETRNQWLVEKTIPHGKILEPIKDNGYKINRSKFHKAIKMSVEDWIKELRIGEDVNLREKMKIRMNQIIEAHYPRGLPEVRPWKNNGVV